jgi:hypothetical protein
MKPTRPKIHLIDVDDPLLVFCGLRMRCGAEILHAAPVFMLTEGIATIWPAQTCQRCIHLAPVGWDKRHYLYGLVEAQAEKWRQAEAWAEVS